MLKFEGKKGIHLILPLFHLYDVIMLVRNSFLLGFWKLCEFLFWFLALHSVVNQLTDTILTESQTHFKSRRINHFHGLKTV